MKWIFWLLIIHFAKSEDVDLGLVCTFDSTTVFQSCNYTLQDVSQDAPCNDSGTIQTPEFPNQMGFSSPSTLGSYFVHLVSCPGSVITLHLYSDSNDFKFDLATSGNQFKVYDIGFSLIRPILTGQEGSLPTDLPGGVSYYNYTTRGREMWLQLSAFEAGCRFKIAYSIEMGVIKEATLTDARGQLSSSYFDGEPYPIGAEHRFLIDVDVTYQDLLFTVDSLNINGSYGDYLKIGQGLDVFVSQKSAMISWQINKGTKFLVEGTKAHVVFKTFKRADTASGKIGYSLMYEVIGKNLTTPAPLPTTPPTPTTPRPTDPSVQETELVFRNYTLTLGGQTYETFMTDFLNQYLDDHPDYLDGWSLTIPLTEELIVISSVEHCYGGWLVDVNLCRHVVLSVNSFKTDGVDVDFTFRGMDIKEAIRSSSYYDLQITFPDELTNAYVNAILITVAVVIFILIASLVLWKQIMKIHYRKTNRYNNLRSSKSDQRSVPGAAANGFPINEGNDNLGFVKEEEDTPRNLVMFDPSERRIYPGSTAHESRSPTRTINHSDFRNRSASEYTDVDEQESTRESVPPPLVYLQPPKVPQRPLRGILKTVVPPLKVTITPTVELEDMTEIDLGDNATKSSSTSGSVLVLNNDEGEMLGETHL